MTTASRCTLSYLALPSIRCHRNTGAEDQWARIRSVIDDILIRQQGLKPAR